jgi:hypothetical protein
MIGVFLCGKGAEDICPLGLRGVNLNRQNLACEQLLANVTVLAL